MMNPYEPPRTHSTSSEVGLLLAEPIAIQLVLSEDYLREVSQRARMKRKPQLWSIVNAPFSMFLLFMSSGAWIAGQYLLFLVIVAMAIGFWVSPQIEDYTFIRYHRRIGWLAAFVRIDITNEGYQFEGRGLVSTSPWSSFRGLYVFDDGLLLAWASNSAANTWIPWSVVTSKEDQLRLESFLAEKLAPHVRYR